MKGDIHILHGDNFGGQFIFYEELFANGCCGLYKLKCLKSQFSLSKNLNLNSMEWCSYLFDLWSI